MSNKIKLDSAVTDYQAYIMDSSNQITSIRHGGRDNKSFIYTYEDGTRWVRLDTKEKERFCGYLYMQTALKASKLQHKLLPAENKMALDGRRIIYLSKYCDEERPTILGNYDITTELQALAEVGFIDIVGWTNLRMISDRVYVFDTEKASFAENVREKIDSFGSCHDAIRAILEEKLKG